MSTHVHTSADRLHSIALTCAREFARDYNDQQDLASQAVLCVLQYEDEITHLKQFVRTVIRNLHINYRRSTGRRELTGLLEYGNPGEVDVEAGPAYDPALNVFLSDTLARMEASLTPGELRCYRLLADGFEQQDLPGLLNVSRQAVSKTLASIRRKYLAAEGVLEYR